MKQVRDPTYLLKALKQARDKGEITTDTYAVAGAITQAVEVLMAIYNVLDQIHTEIKAKNEAEVLKGMR